MIYNYIIRYPFSNKAKEFLKANNIDLLEIDEDILKKATIFLLKSIDQPQSQKEKQWSSYRNIEDLRLAKLFVKIYPISKILLKLVESVPLIQSFANYYQLQTRYFLNNRKEDTELEDLKDELCPEIKILDDDQYYINLIDLLSLNLGDDFDIVYSNLEEGKIKLKKNELINLLSIIVKKKIIRSIDSSTINTKNIPSMFLEYSKYIKNKTTTKLTDKFSNTKINKPDIERYPPCFKVLYTKLINGNQLGHLANYHLCVFLANIGYSYNEILEIYKNAPNYDKKIASYQIRKIIEKKYSVANCQTLKSNGLCVKDCKVAHPLQLLENKKNNKNDKYNKKKDKYENKKNK
jgi:DNA primase large subunit